MSTSYITSHVLDTSLGRPAVNVEIILETQVLSGDTTKWRELGREKTNQDGRVTQLCPMHSTNFIPGVYRLQFLVAPYFEAQGISASFYPEITITFTVKSTQEHYHVPLLLNPFGYSTYRGS